MTNKELRATGSQHNANIVAGSWKFQDKSHFKLGTTTEELAETAILMVNARIGTGTFHHVFVRGTGHDELGICFMYQVGDGENDKDLRLRFEDFFRRRHGIAFKGWDLGYGITAITLES